MIYKRLGEEGGFSWPQISNGVLQISRVQFEALFDGVNWKRVGERIVATPTAATNIANFLASFSASLAINSADMMPSFNSARLAELPADLRALFEAQRAMLEAERIRADRERQRAEHELVARLHVESELAASKETVERLQLLVKEYERARFGKRSEKFDPDQLQLVLEDIEIAIAEVQEARMIARAVRDAPQRAKGPAAPRAPFPPICRASCA